MKKSFLVDVNGVLYVGEKPIPGAIEAIDFLRNNDHKFRLVTNATQSSTASIQKKLCAMGFSIKAEEIFSPSTATIEYIKNSGKNKCFLLSCGDVENEFLSSNIYLTEKNPDYVVVGDAAENFSFENMNKAFRLLLGGAELLAMEKDRHWMASAGPALAAGPYVAALEYASEKKAAVLGKPSRDFFASALRDMGARSKDTVMVGDDIFTDIQGAQAAGLRAWLVRTGKYSAREVKETKIVPDKILDSIAELKKEINR